MAEKGDGLAWLGRYSLAVVAASLIACYGPVALVAVLSALGVAVSAPGRAWAALVVALAWIGVLAMGVNLRRHGNIGPFLLADVGALLVSWVMLVAFDGTMQAGGFVLLTTAALWDWKLRWRNKPCRD